MHSGSAGGCAHKRRRRVASLPSFSRASPPAAAMGDPRLVRLNVGGTTFLASKATLLARGGHVLASMFGGDMQPGATLQDGAVWLDCFTEGADV